MRIRSTLRIALICISATAAFSMVTAPGFAAPKSQVANAGKDGVKSNAGGGNGTEDVQVGEPVTVVTTDTVITDSTNTTTSDPVIVSTTVTTTEIGRVQSDKSDVQVGNSDNFKRYFDVTYEVVTTTGTETTVTTETVQLTEVYSTSTTTTDMQDIDPGRSQPVNQAPEGEPDDIVVIDGPSLTSSSSEVIGTDVTVVPDTDIDTTTDVVEDQEVLCNGSEGQNEGTDYCG